MISHEPSISESHQDTLINPESLKTPMEAIAEEVYRRVNPFILIGEDHTDYLSMRVELEALQLLKEVGGKFVFFEEEFTENRDRLIDAFMKTGNMPEELKEYLTISGPLREGFQMQHPFKYLMLLKCRELGLEPVFIDSRPRNNEDTDWKNIMIENVGNPPKHPSIAFLGVLHTLKSYKIRSSKVPTLASQLTEEFSDNSVVSVAISPRHNEFGGRGPSALGTEIDELVSLLNLELEDIAITTKSLSEETCKSLTFLGTDLTHTDVVVSGPSYSMMSKNLMPGRYGQ